MARLAALARFTDEPGRLTRLFLSPAHRQAVDAVAAMLGEAGCDRVEIDALGSVVGRYEGAHAGAPALLIGSHIDTVRDAGAYDGNLGVVAGIGIVEALAAAGERLPFALEVLAFGDEENVRFPTHLSSSRALAGRFDFASLHSRDADGVSLRDALVAFGGAPDAIDALARPRGSVLGYLEMHIEQGPVLEDQDLPVGIVSAINGASRLRVTVAGQAGHAGTVPMALRCDALAGAAEMVLAVEERGAAFPDTVATVGRLTVEPGAPNVIPGRVAFSVDARGPQDATRTVLVDSMKNAFARIARRRGLLIELEHVTSTPACPCDPTLIALLEQAVRRQQLRPLLLASGAGHDAMAMADLCPVGMLFVRCKGGISHNPAESITQADADTAMRVLQDFVRGFRAV
jgi:allantoate deiminase